MHTERCMSTRLVSARKSLILGMEMGHLRGPSNLASGRRAVFVQALSCGFIAALLSPPRRTRAAVHATARNAADYHCIMDGEAAQQHRFLPPSLYERRTVRLALAASTSATYCCLRAEERRRARLTAPRSGTE